MTLKNRSYSNIHSAKRALRKAGLSAMAVVFDTEPANGLGRERIVPIIQCRVADDAADVRRQGFKAEVKAGKAAR